MNLMETIAPIALTLAAIHLMTAAVLVPPLLLWLRHDQRTSAATRHWFCRVAVLVLLALLAVPLVPRPDPWPGTATVNAPTVAPMEAPAGDPATARTIPATVAAAAAPGEAADSTGVESAAPRPAASRGFDRWLLMSAFLTWAIVALALLARLVLALHGNARLRRAATPLREPENAVALAPVCRILEHPDIDSPLVLGIFRPVIVLPQGFVDRASAPELAAVLRHEEAHVRRHDALEELLARVLAALCWFNPMLVALNRARTTEREAACDDAAAHEGIARGAYARLLLDLATGRRANLVAITMAGAVRRELEARIAALYATRPRDLPGKRPRRVALALAILGAGLLAAALPRVVLLPAAAAEMTPTESATQGHTAWSRDLTRAVMISDAARVDEILAKRPADAGPEALQSALVAASRLPDPTGFERLIDAGADWRGIDGGGAFLMSVAAASSAPVLAELLALGADPDGAPEHFTPPLIAAARNPDQRALELLLATGAELETRFRSMTPLIATMSFGPNRAMLANLEWLIAAGADVNRVVDSDPNRPTELADTTALHHAVAMGRPRFAARLLDAGADPNHLATRHLPDGTMLSIAPLTEANRQARATGSNAMAELLRRYGAVSRGDTAEVIEAALARHALRNEDQFRELTSEETRHVLDVVSGAIPGLPSEITFAQKPVMITRQEDGRWTLTEPLAAWPESTHRRRSHLVACELPAGSESDWSCRSAKERYRQRLDVGQRWFTVSGELDEARVRELVDFARSAAPGCPA
ncbi:MAG: M56 family metallopeptidase, partial [Pseudomonadota bacterium]